MKKHLLLAAIILSSLISRAQFDPANNYFYTGIALFESNNFQLAINSFDSAIVLMPRYNDALNFRGLSRFNMGQYNDAAADYQQIINNDPNYYSAYINLANTYMRMGEFRRTEDILQQARNLNPTASDGFNITGNMYFSQGQFQEAKNYYLTLLRFDPQNDIANFNLGNTYFRLRMYDSAAYYHQIAIRQKPNIPDYMFNLALDYGSSNYAPLHQQSLDIAQRIVTIDPTYSRAHAQIAYLLMENQGFNPQIVMPYLDKAIQLQPKGSWYAYANRGNLYTKMGMYDSAMNDYNRGIRDFPGNIYAYTGRAALYRDSGMYSEALKDYLRAAYLNPTDPYPYLALGDMMVRLGYYSVADSFFNSYLQYSGSPAEANSNIYNVKAFALLNNGNYKEALESANRSLFYSPDFAYALNNKGRAYAGLGMTDSALIYINRSLEYDSYNSYAYHNRALVNLQNGRRDLACTDLQRALEMHYPLPFAPELQKIAAACNVKLPAHTPRSKPDLQQIFSEISREESQLITYRNMLSENSFFNIQNISPASLNFTTNYSLLIYPNPATDRVNIAPNQFPRDPFSILVFSTGGRIVRSNTDLQQSETGISFDLSDLQTGRYVVMLISRNALLAKSILWVNRL